MLYEMIYDMISDMVQYLTEKKTFVRTMRPLCGLLCAVHCAGHCAAIVRAIVRAHCAGPFLELLLRASCGDSVVSLCSACALMYSVFHCRLAGLPSISSGHFWNLLGLCVLSIPSLSSCVPLDLRWALEEVVKAEREKERE